VAAEANPSVFDNWPVNLFDKGPLTLATADRQEYLEYLTRELLRTIGEDPTRDGLVDTPRRVAKWWMEFVNYQPGTTDTAFEWARARPAGNLVVASGIRVWSLCEHHLLPFWVDVTIGYIPAGQLLGLSKFARIAHQAAHRLQLQERLIAEIADQAEKATGTADVAVYGTGEHLCMTMRGIRTVGQLASQDLRGDFVADDQLRREFLDAAKPQR
jgi:GTP cyclohydrolase I